MKKDTKQSSRKVLRSEEIYRCLLVQYDLPQLTKKFPSVREIKDTFRCGQNVATEALNRLAEHYHFKRTPRGKSYLALDISGISWKNVWHDFQYQKRECTIMLSQDIAFCWQPVIDEYNRTHPSTPIRTHLICHVEEFRLLSTNASVDLVLLPNHPCLIGLKGFSGFKNLTQLAQTLPCKDYYKSMFLYDSAGQLRGIAPALVPKLLFFNKHISEIPEKNITMNNLYPLLRKIKQNSPSLLYAAVFDSYLSFFSYCGLDPARSMKNHFRDWKQWEKRLELFQTMYRENLIPSVLDLVNYGYSFFADHQAAMIELYYSKIPRLRDETYSDFIPPPQIIGAPYCIASEMLGICQGSIRYEQAWNFIVFLLQPHVQQLLLSRMNAFSILRGLKPCHMSESFYRRIEPLLADAVRRESDSIMTPQLFRCFESGMDSLVKYGGSIQHFLEDFQDQYNILKERGIL